jgi:hypothetical protein
MIVTRKSMISGKIWQMDLPITNEQVAAYDSGVLLQDAFPNLSNVEREFYKTGITGEEWDATFGDDDE